WAEVDGIAVLTLARPAVNALSAELCTAVAEGLRGPRLDGVRAVVLTGAGRAFSAGVDLRSVVDGGADYPRRLLPALTDVFRTAFTLPVPLVAAVNGHAIAGGCVLAACAAVEAVAGGRVDRVLAADELQSAALAAAAELADRMPADTFAHTKAQLRRDA